MDTGGCDAALCGVWPVDAGSGALHGAQAPSNKNTPRESDPARRDSMRISAALAMAAALMGLAFGSAGAQDFPTRPITWVVGFPPGGISDQGARMVAKTLGEKIGQTVIVENKPGAGGIV